MHKHQLNNFTIIILLCLFIRHYFFYFGDDLATEFGYDQPFLAFMMTPTTGMMCAAVFWKNKATVQLNIATWFLISFSICAGVLYSYNLQILDKYFIYDIYDHSRRPPLYILFPIAGFLATREPTRTVCFFIASFVYLFEQNFILHYFILFYLSSRIYPRFSERLELPALVIWFFALAIIYFYEIVRVNIFIEFLWVTGSLVIAERLAILTALIGIKIKYRPKILIFYLIQAVFFTIASRFLSDINIWYLGACFVACIFLTFAFASTLEKCFQRFSRFSSNELH